MDSMLHAATAESLHVERNAVSEELPAGGRNNALHLEQSSGRSQAGAAVANGADGKGRWGWGAYDHGREIENGSGCAIASCSDGGGGGGDLRPVASAETRHAPRRDPLVPMLFPWESSRGASSGERAGAKEMSGRGGA